MQARRFAGFVAAACVGVAGCADRPGPTPPFGAPKHELLFEGDAAGIPEIFRVDTAPGSTPERLLPAGTVGMDPTPSPDGSRVAFVVANYVDGTGDIFVVNRDGTGLHQLTDDPELDDSPAWSPDGQRIAFRSYRAGYDGEIWVMNADGSGLVNLTPTTGSAIIDHRRPSWSPDGKFIVHASTLGGNWDIWVMRADGSDQRRLTNTADLDAEPAWSTDGSLIAFRRSDATGSDIMIVPAAGGDAVRIALAGDQRSPSWPPTGSMLAFSSQPTAASRPEIMIMTPGGQGIRAITSAAWGGASEPAWARVR